MTDYIDLKKTYYRLLANTKTASKGDIRAYIGTKTNIYESNTSTKVSAIDCHLIAFESALIDLSALLKRSKNKIEFKKELEKELISWRGLHITDFDRKPANAPLLPPPIPHIREWHPNKLNMVSLFSGAFGLDLGFLAAGFDHRFSTDIDKLSFETAKGNLPLTPFILDDFDNVPSAKILEQANLNIGEVDVLIGGPPCQPFSTAGKRQGFNDPRSSPLRGFVRAIKDLQPRAFVMEEVTGLESSRLAHVPINERDKKVLMPEEEPGSAFREVLKMLDSTGYSFVYGRLNAADFGAPQIRERLVFIGLRKGKPHLPSATHSSDPVADMFSSALFPWNCMWESLADLHSETEFVSYSPKIKKYMRLIPPGGHWRQLPAKLIPEALGGAYESGGGKMGFFRRLAWDEPAPTLVTTPLQKGTIFGHPDFLRPIGVREYKRIQGFPDDWYLPGTTRDKYKLIGNAVSVHFSYALALHVKKLLGG